MNRFVRRVAIPGAAAVVIATGGFAFMASNSVASTHAGSGEGAISGYNVTGIHYATAPAYGGDAYLKTVSFHLNHAASADNVGVYVYSNYQGHPGRWTNCTADDGTNMNFTCKPYTSNEPAVTVGGMTKIVVSAAQ